MEAKARFGRLMKEIDALRDPVHGYVRAGTPRFEHLFGRDSLIFSWQRLEREPAIAVATLRLLASMQGKVRDARSGEEPGKILHEWSPEPLPWVRWKFPYYGSVDATPLFIIVASWTVRRMGDERLRDELWPHVKAAAGWVMAAVETGPRGLVCYDPQVQPFLVHQGWKDSHDLGPKNPTAMIEVQGYAYAALRHAAAWADTYDPRSAAVWREEAERLKGRVNDMFWAPSAGTYAMAVQDNGSWFASVTSNPGHLLFTGIVPEERAAKVVEKLFSDTLRTDYGIRTLSIKDPDFQYDSYHKGSIWPHDNWIISEGLRALGRADERKRIKDALLAADDALGCLPELYAVHHGQIEPIQRAQYPQAWASGALLNLLDSSLDPKTAIPLLPP